MSRVVAALPRGTVVITCINIENTTARDANPFDIAVMIHITTVVISIAYRPLTLAVIRIAEFIG